VWPIEQLYSAISKLYEFKHLRNILNYL